jgi:hypothetical protein
MTPRPLALLIPFLLLVGHGCKSAPSTASTEAGGDEIELPETEDTVWPDAIRLNNGTVTVVVVPSIGGRIMRYARTGEGENVLWTNPDVQPRSVLGRDEPTTTTPSAWRNFGGDKAWPWPQDQWPLYTGRTWPPPSEADHVPFKPRLIGRLGVRLESPPLPGYSARIVREISLEPTGTRVNIVTRFERVDSDGGGGGGDVRRRPNWLRGRSRNCTAAASSTRGSWPMPGALQR